jgi:hypothetical protein
MLLKRVEKDGIIKAIYDSSNVVGSIYNKSNNELSLIFKAGTKYKYSNVSRSDYLRLELADSQGSVFSTHFKGYIFEKQENVDISKILEETATIKNQEYNVELANRKERLTKTLKGTVLLLDLGKPFAETLEALKKDIDNYLNKLKEKKDDE